MAKYKLLGAQLGFMEAVIRSKTPILIVDDDERNLLAVEAALADLDCECVKAHSDKEALHYLEKREFAAVLLDINMPGLDGFETAKEMQGLNLAYLPPVIFVTALEADAERVTKEYSFGAVDFITKPINAAALRSKIRVFQKLHDQQKQLDALSELKRTSTVAERTVLFNNALDAVIGVDQEDRIIDWNRQAEVTFGWTKDEALGTKLGEKIIPHNMRERHRRGFEHFLKTGEGPILNKRVQVFALHKNGSTFPVELTVIPLLADGSYRFYSFLRDLSEQKRVEAEKELLQKNLKFLSDATKTLLDDPLGFESRLEKLAAVIVPELADWCVVDLLDAHGNLRLVAVGHVDPMKLDLTRELRRLFPPNADVPAGPAHVARTGKSELAGEIPQQLLRNLSQSEEHFRKLTQLGLKSYICVPLKTRGHVLGALTVVSAESGRRFSDQDLTLLEELATRAGSAIDNALLFQEAVEARNRLQQSEEKFRTVTDNAASCLFMMDKNGYPTFMNPAAKKVTGYQSLDEIKDKPLHYAVHYKKPDGSHYPMEECPIDNAQAELKTLQNQQEIFVDKNGKLYPVSYSITPLEKNGEIVGSVLEFKDITAQKAAEAELRRAKEEAERANMLKSAFLANMSHEIRTPLGAMIGFADLLRDQGLSPSERESYIDILSRNGHQLSSIINDILDLSKVEAGHLTLEFTDANPEQIAADVISLFRIEAREKNLALEYIREDSTPQIIVTDTTRTRQVLLNLVSNAIKFTHFGSVKVRSFGYVDQKGNRFAGFEITDTGIGIAKDQYENIFGMFVQADGSMTRRFGGTGLGLSLSRQLARELGGEVTIIDSEDGVGTTMRFTVADQPQKREAQLVEPTAPKIIEVKENALNGLRVLVVDDAPDNQQLIWRYLTKQGAVIESAENGLIGYRKALAGKFDIVLMDIQMPEMDGYTATEKLRAAGFRQPIIAITAHAMTDVRRQCLNVGCTDHLPKPIDPKQLIATVARLTSRPV